MPNGSHMGQDPEVGRLQAENTMLRSQLHRLEDERDHYQILWETGLDEALDAWTHCELRRDPNRPVLIGKAQLDSFILYQARDKRTAVAEVLQAMFRAMMVDACEKLREWYGEEES